MQERDAMDENPRMNKLQENLDKNKDNLEEVILLSKRKEEEELYLAS